MNYETSLDNPVNVDMADDDIEARAKRRRWIIIAAVVVLLLVGAVIAKKMMGSEAPAANSGADQAQTVTVVAPGSETVTRKIQATGTLAARRDIPVGVVGEGGQVTQVYVDAGSWVRQGQVMASVDRSVQTQQAAALQAQIGVARADLQLAQNELDRALKLVDRGFISKADVDRKTAARDAASARVKVAGATLGEAQARTARLDIRAPVSGYVLERNVQVGQTVGAGSGTLFRLAKDGEMELQAQLGENDLRNLSVGVPATVTPTGTEQQFTGRIWQMSPVINPQTRQGIARISLPFNVALRPGGFASVEIASGAVSAPILPESAVQNDDKGSFVYIVGKGNKVERRTVTTGDVTDKGLIIASGLNGTERVVLFAGGFLNPGETVNPKLQKN